MHTFSSSVVSSSVTRHYNKKGLIILLYVYSKYVKINC